MGKPKIRLKPFEAIALGFEVKKDYSNGNPKYSLTTEQITELNKLRYFHNTNFTEVKRTLNKDGEVISKTEKIAPKELIDIPLNHEIKRVSTNVSTKQQWVITEPIKEKEYKELKIGSIIWKDDGIEGLTKLKVNGKIIEIKPKD